MNITMEIPVDIDQMEAALEGLVELGRVQIEAGLAPVTPGHAGVHYEREASGLEEWRSPVEVLKYGCGDCEDLNGWLAAGYRASGYDPYARLVLEQTGAKTYHAIVELSSGERVDCCPELGMRVPGADVAGVGAFGVSLPSIVTRIVSRGGGGARTAATDGGLRDHRANPTAYTPTEAGPTSAPAPAPAADPYPGYPTTNPAAAAYGQPYPYGQPYGQPYGYSPYEPSMNPAAAAVYAQQISDDVDYAAAYEDWLAQEHPMPLDEEDDS